MNEDLLIKIALTGVGATLVMDSWSWIQRHALHIPTFRYPLVGRWILAMRHGTFTHKTIMTTPAARGETAVGWAAHYLTGVLFAFFLWLLAGAQWFTAPTPGPALAAGLLTTLAPFALMQPALGFGFAASKTPSPVRARLLSLTAHLVFGGGLYLAAWVITLF
ncbi:DUF2938 domain-containing protein [Cronobacter turicensis]